MAGINASLVKKCFLAGAQGLDAKKAWINELNVFPVPDGDTGTNMTMTIMSAVREVMSQEQDTMESICKAISSGALRGARGNSGVILSQLFRGFAKSAREHEELTIPDVAEAFEKAVETAYKAVMKPKEGTILTVAKGMADKAMELRNLDDMNAYFEEILKYGDEVLEHTPELLPVLKQAGVVDSGGQGLMVVLHSAYDAFSGKEVDITIPDAVVVKKEEFKVDVSNLDTSDIKFGYCTEFIILLDKEFSEEEEDRFKAYLESIGDSIVCVADDEVVKIHVHTNDPGLAIQRALTYGQLTKMKIDNMREEHQERLFSEAEKAAAKKADEEKRAAAAAAQAEPKKDIGFVAVAAGDGLSKIFKDLGADCVIEGGQTMNPSTEDVLSAIHKVNAETVFVLPNNKNIIMAANQAALLTEEKKVIVIPSKTVCQGLSCLINFMPGGSAEDNEAAMTEMMAMTQTIEVTYAIRDTSIDGVEIHKDDYMAIGDKGILNCGTDLTQVVKEAVAQCASDETALVSLYYGEDVKEEEAQAIAEAVSGSAPDAEIEVNYGGQPVYYYIISVE